MLKKIFDDIKNHQELELDGSYCNFGDHENSLK